MKYSFFSKINLKRTVLITANLINVVLLLGIFTEIYLCQIGRARGVCTFYLLDIIPAFLGVCFLVFAFYVINQNRQFIEPLFFIWGGGLILSGIISSVLTSFETEIFNVYLVFYAPIILQFNLSFLSRKLRKIESISLYFLYITATILSISLTFSFLYLPDIDLYNLYLKSINRGFISVGIIWTIFLLWDGYSHFSSLIARRKIRIMMICTTLAVMPLVFLTILPQALKMNYIAVAINFPWLLIILLGYLYSTFRPQLSYAENTFRSVMVYFMLGIIAITLFLIASQVQKLIPGLDMSFYPILIAAFLMVVIFMPLRRSLYYWVDWAFYGNESDYQTSLEYLESLLASVLNREGIIYLLLEELTAAIKPTYAILFLREKDSHLVYAGCKGTAENLLDNVQLNLESPLAMALVKTVKPMRTDEIKRLIPLEKYQLGELALIESPQVALWLPLVSEDFLQGLLLLSLREGDNLYTEKDKKLLSNLLIKAGAAIRTIILSESIIAGKEELSQAHYRLITGQEEERKRIARDLHDDTIQRLLGISYQVADVKNRMNGARTEGIGATGDFIDDLEEVRDHISEAVWGIRKMINELRPAGLDEFGIRVTLENMVQQIQQKLYVGRMEFSLDIDPDADNLPEMQSICIYRICQEALRNIVKHADASRIFIELSIREKQVRILIEDDGQGFVVPERVSELALTNHFGLIGIMERACSIGGMASIISDLGIGTKIDVTLPLDERNKENEFV